MRIIACWLLLCFAAAWTATAPTAAAAEKKPDTDNVVYDRVLRRIANDRDLKTTAIEITVNEGVVILKGLIDSKKQRQRVEQVVRKTPGVKKIVNEVKVRP
jgi:osmotically-inducible protein OsmY